MNVALFQADPGYPSIRYFFATAIPLMILTLLGWYAVKHFLARRRQTPYQRGIYEQFFFELATAYPRLWSRSGPNEDIEPVTGVDRFKWRLVTLWNDPSRTIRAGAGGDGAEYDDLGSWSRIKRTLTKRWISQMRVSEKDMGSSSSTTLEEGGRDTYSHVEHKEPEQRSHIMRTAAKVDLPGGMLEVPSSPEGVTTTTFMSMETTASRRGSAGSVSGSSTNRNSGIMIEEEPSTWLKDYGVKPGNFMLY